MTFDNCEDIEDWLDSHHDFTWDYFLRKAEFDFINRWLVAHGFLTIHEYVTSRRGSSSTGSPYAPNSPSYKDKPGELFNADDLFKMQKSTSTHHLRAAFSANRTKSCLDSESLTSITTRRRASFRESRRFTSLPQSSSQVLSILIESKVKLPQFSSTLDAVRMRNLRNQDENAFFLSLIQNISHEPNMKSLTKKIVNNLTILMDCACASLFLVEGPPDKKLLVSKQFDVFCGVNVLPSFDENEMQAVWGTGIIGHVAKTGETVCVDDASKVRKNPEHG